MRKFIRAGFVAAVFAVVLALPSLPAVAYEQSGVASWYASLRVTASGESSHSGAMVAAHKSLPFGTLVRVTNKRNGRSVTVRIIDRGPYIRGRIIDLTPGGARAIGFYGAGIARVKIETIGRVVSARCRYRCGGSRYASRKAKRYLASKATKRRATVRKRIRVASLRKSHRVRKTVRVRRSGRRIDNYFTRLSETSA